MTVIKTSNTQVDDIFDTYRTKARMTMIDSDVVARHVDRTTLPSGSGKTWNEPKLSQPDAGAWQEGESHPEATLTDSNLQVTPAMSGLKIIITKRHMDMANENLGAKMGVLLGTALDNYKDDQLITNFDSFTVSLPGAGSAFTLGGLRAARARIRHGNGGEPYKGNDFHGIFHPYTMHDLMESIGGFSAGNPTMAEAGVPGELVKKYAIYNIVGVQCEEDSNITADGSDDAKSAVFAREAIRLVDFTQPETDKEFIKDTGSWVFYGHQDFGHGLYSLVWGAEIYADVAAPTA